MMAIQEADRAYSLLLTPPLLRELCEPIFKKVRAVISQAIRSVVDSGGLIDRQRMCEYAGKQLDRIEAELEADPLADGLWSGKELEDEEA